VAAPDISDLEAFFHANDVKDQMGVQVLVNSGRVFALARNTRVHVLSAAIGRAQVRVLDGTYVGRAVWVDWDTLGTN
jgi:hypothetical protein